MKLDPQLPKDAAGAAQLLAELIQKDQENVCLYPTCHEPPRPPLGNAPTKFCNDHRSIDNIRARDYLKRLANPDKSHAQLPKREKTFPAMTASLESAQSLILSELSRVGDLVQTHFPAYILALDELTDPETTTDQIQAEQHQANLRLAEMQATVDTERRLRQEAEKKQKALQDLTNASQEAAEQAIAQMDEAIQKRAEIEALITTQQEEAERQIAIARKEHDEAINQVRVEAQRLIEDVQRQAEASVLEARNEVEQAQKEERIAKERAQATETEALSRIKIAEQLLADAREQLRRAQETTAALRLEYTESLKTERARAAEDRALTQ